MADESQIFYHGTRADLKPGDLLAAGYRPNFGDRPVAGYIYFSATLEAATWGAELALGDAPGCIYVVAPTGPFHDDPNLTDKKFPGNPTRSYRSKDPLRIVREVIGWQGHSPQQLQTMRDSLARLKARGEQVIED